ncbi:MAG: ABC transporter permease [Cyanobacteria bacterium]|nr:ABC transporter permease [Cyanobacteriota bacterium]
MQLLKDRAAVIASVILVLLYGAIALADFISPYSEQWSERAIANAPPTGIYMIDANTQQLTWPYVFRYTRAFNPESFSYEFQPDLTQTYPIKFLVHGETYHFWGLIPSDIHLFGVDAPGKIGLLGFDMNGRDNFSRLLFGGQVSMTIGFLGLFIAIPIGLLYGGISGYIGGLIDGLMMRFAEIMMSIPQFYLLISLAAILPADIPSSIRFSLVVVILAFIGWAGLSRVIRGMVLSIKSQEFIEAERALGLDSFRIITRHLLPQTASYVIIAVTLGVPGYILAESGLSFLGLGIQQPDASWGNMLKEAQDITNIISRPWMLTPGLLIFLAVLSFNVIGDALRDILDPKSAHRQAS